MKECPSRTQGTIEHFKTSRWVNINKRTINGYGNNKVPHYVKKGVELRMTKEEFYSWCEGQFDHISKLFKEGQKPSIDRIDPDGHYEISNLRILSWSENSSLTRKETKRIKATHKTTGEIRYYRGFWTEEFRKEGFDPSSCQKIAKRVHGKGTYSKGWTFEYVD